MNVAVYIGQERAVTMDPVCSPAMTIPGTPAPGARDPAAKVFGRFERFRTPGRCGSSSRSAGENPLP